MACQHSRAADSLQEAVIISGFGGQGIVLAGRLLAHAAMLAGREVTVMPSYGAEVRGGASNCTVVIASQPIASPVISFPDCVIAMSKAALSKFGPTVRPGGWLLYNNCMSDRDPTVDTTVTAMGVPADRLATDLGGLKAANMVMIGAYLQTRGILDLDAVIRALPAVLTPRHHNTIPLNTRALHGGAEFARSVTDSPAGSARRD
jgi:2-oxoglutarate ferredoxin oxidoreductase subunit gamma